MNADRNRAAQKFNFVTSVVERLAAERPHDRALAAVSGAGDRRSFSFENVAQAAAQAAARLSNMGVGPGDVVMTLMGARPEWVFAMLGTWRLGAIALPCSEQLRRKDIAHRIRSASPTLAVLAERDASEFLEALGDVETPPAYLNVDSDSLLLDEQPPQPSGSVTDPALMVFTSGTAGEPRAAIHSQRYLWGQSVQAEHWLGADEDDLVWCTAASGWSKSARNSFVAPWTRGAACLLHDARFDPDERLDLVARERVTVLCQSPTEYRMLAKGSSLDRSSLATLRRLVSAGEPLNPEVMATFNDAVGLDIYDGYGQTETGQLTGVQVGEQVRPGSMGRPLPGFELEVVDQHDQPVEEGELCLDPATVPTFFGGYLGEPTFQSARWRTGDRVRRDEDGYLWFQGRLDDVILSAGYRIGPFEVESALVGHPAVVEAAAVSAPDPDRGAVVRAVVVLRDGYSGDDRLASELKEHVKESTAPYKYPRVIEFRDALPKTSSGKIKRAELRDETPGVR